MLSPIKVADQQGQADQSGQQSPPNLLSHTNLITRKRVPKGIDRDLYSMISSQQLREPSSHLNRPDSMRRKLKIELTIFKTKKTDTCRRFFKLGKKRKRYRSWKMNAIWLWRNCGKGSVNQKFNAKWGQAKQSLSTRHGNPDDSSLRTVSISDWSKRETKTASSVNNEFKLLAKNRIVWWHSVSNRQKIWEAKRKLRFRHASSTVI